MPIKLNTASSGSVTLDAANTASNFTITVPATTATMLTNKTAGTVLQVVQGIDTAQTSSTTSTFANTGISTSITPTSATSKILIFAYLGSAGKTTADTQLNMRIQRASTTIFSASAVNQGTIVALLTNPTLVYLDSPATTSPTTYTVQLANRDNAGAVFVNQNGTATITLMEIAA